MSRFQRPAVRRALAAAAGAVVVALSACGGSGGSDAVQLSDCTLGQDVRIEVIAGNGQSGTVGNVLASDLQVRVLCRLPATITDDQRLEVVQNAGIVWTVTAGDGTVGGATSTTTVTGENGTAVVSWTLGPVVGTQTVTATLAPTNLPGLTATAQTFSANAQ